MISPGHVTNGIVRTAIGFSIATFLQCFGWTSCSHGQSVDDYDLPIAKPEYVGLNPSSFDAIENRVLKAIEAKQLPGAVVLIGYRGHVVFHRAFGHRQLQPNELPMERDTVFDLASLTKPIATATSIMILVDRGELDIDEPVAKTIPAFASAGKERVTIRHLLIHTSGLIPDNSMSDYQGTREEIVQRLFLLGLRYPTGTDFQYSDVGFQVLGELVEAVSNKRIDEFSRLNIFEPLRMKQTGYLPSDSLRTRCATTQERDGNWMIGEVHDPRSYAMGGVAGHAGLFSTASDIAIYATMILNQGSYQSTMILSPSAVELMTADNQVPKNGIRGLGWDKRTGYSSNRGRSMSDQAVGHGGFTGTGLWIDPTLELFVIFLSNRVHPDGKGNVNPLIGEIGTIAADAVLEARLSK